VSKNNLVQSSRVCSKQVDSHLGTSCSTIIFAVATKTIPVALIGGFGRQASLSYSALGYNICHELIKGILGEREGSVQLISLR
jgi:uncharacterized membrane protein